MYFGFLPPEINSGLMYAGPGSGSMLTAAAAWDGLAAQLHATAASYSSLISGLTTTWRGPSSVSMAAAAAPYMAWMSVTATQAEGTAAQARAAAAAYETAFATTVPPGIVAANRSELASLVATNLFGQNTPAIAANEAQYSQMWARDATAMSTYAGQSAAATTVTPFAVPPSTTNPGGLLGQLLAALQTLASSVGSSAQTEFSQLFAAVPTALQSFTTIVTGPHPASGLLTALQDFAGLQTLNSISGDVELIPKLILPVNDVMITTIMALVFATKGVTASAAHGAAAGGAAAALGSGTSLVDSAALGAAGQTVSAGAGRAGLIGGMSVPPTWATATPAIRTVASVLSGAAEAAVPAGAVSEGTLLSGMALSGMAGGALGAAASDAVRGAAGSLRTTSLKDGSPKDGESPETLQRLVAEMAEKPDNVQHWHTDEAGLEGLLARLKKKPGIHAVHLSDGDPNNIKLPKAQP
jgi:PPE-repeat protein